MKSSFSLFLLFSLFLTNCVTTETTTKINGTAFNTGNGSTIIVGYLGTEEAAFPGDFKEGPHSVNVNYPEMARRARIEGTVIAYLDINEKGELLKSRITRGIGGGCDEATLQIIGNSTYTPAKNQNGDPVIARHYVSIKFRL